MSQFADVNPYAPGEVAIQKFPSGPIEFPGRQIKLSIVYDMDHLIEGINRYRSHGARRISKRITFALRWASALLLIFMAIFAFGFAISEPRMLWAPLFFLVLALATIFTRQIDNTVLRFKLRSTSYLNSRCSVVMNDEGYISGASNQYNKLAWSVFTDAIEHPDGVLIFRGHQFYYWLAFKALERPEDASILYRFIASRLSSEDVTQENLKKDSVQSDAIGKQIRAAIVFNEGHIIESIARNRELRQNWLSFAYNYGIVFILIVAIILIAVLTTYYWVSILAVLLAAFAFFNQGLINRRISRNAKASRHYNETTTITLSDNGFRARSPLQDLNLGWDSFTEVVQFADGVMIYQGNSIFNWIPYRLLEDESDAAIIYDFVSTRIAKSKLPSEDPIADTEE